MYTSDMNAVSKSPYRMFFLLLAITAIVGSGNLFVADEGLIVSGAAKILSGEKLYADFFGYIAPGSFFLSALAMAIFGASYWSAKVAAIGLVAGSAYALATIARRLGAAESSALAAGVTWILMLAAWFQLVNHNAWSSAIAVIGIALVLAVLERKRNAWEYFGAGGMIGLVPIFLQTKGGLLVAAFVLGALLLAWKRAFSIRRAGAAIAGMILPSLSLLFVWPFATLFDALILWPMHHYREVNQVSIIPFLIAFAAVVFLAFTLFRTITRERWLALGIVLTAQAAMLASVLTRPDLAHIAMAAFLLPIGGAILSEGRSKQKLAIDAKSIPFRIITGFLALFLFLFNCVATAEAEKGLDRIRAIAIRQNPGLYAYPFLPGYALALGQANPYPHDFLFTDMNAPEDFTANLAVLERENPGTILRGRTIGEKFGYDWTNPHDQWIAERYEVADTVEGVEILIRKP